MIEDEAPSSLHCHQCNTEPMHFKCIDCLGSPVFCQQCLLHTHRRNPFHRIQKWTGKCFLRSALIDLGYILHMGHNGQPCPSYFQPTLNTTRIWIVDSTGVHQHQCQWCLCPNAKPLHLQLLNMQLFPSSITNPQTAFTFSVLRHFQIDSVECKTSANNFYNKLRRLSNGAFPHTIPVRAMC